MLTRGISHITISVRDLDRSLRFYRDVLGLRVTREARETVKVPALLANDQRGGLRRAVYLRWEHGPHATFILLVQYPRPATGEAPTFDRVGIHHFSFWVDNLLEMYEKLRAAGAKVQMPPATVDTSLIGEEAGSKVLTTMFEDPDGIVLQLDQRVTG